MNKRIFIVLSLFGLIKADHVEDARILITGIKKTDPKMVYDVLNKRSIDFKNCGEFDYLDFACCKLTACIEKIEHYKEKQKKWNDRIDSEYDQDLVNDKVTHYKSLSDKWSTLKNQIQNIVQMLAIYLGLSQTNAELVGDLAEDIIEVVADVDTIIQNNEPADQSEAVVEASPVAQTITAVPEKIINV